MKSVTVFPLVITLIFISFLTAFAQALEPPDRSCSPGYAPPASEPAPALGTELDGPFPRAALAAAQPAAPVPAGMAADPITLNINIVGGPTTVDPALATDTSSTSVIEQLFIGLVDLDDETAEVRPELATSWTISPDSRVYTFTLRSDVTWSDGNPVTAQDVRYGILRTLDPATASNYAFPLAFLIKNAGDYNNGTITDPNLVGVKALDATHLEVSLEQPASYALSILSMWVARPMPKWAIEAHGSAWTEPGNIVTSGSYRLKEWVHGDHLLLEKNPTYFDAVNVQIENVRMWMVDEMTAWTMYLNGQLDTVMIPLGAALDPIVRQEVRTYPVPCTYYYGFTTTNPPFDNPLVRKAFIAATNRDGLIRDVTRGGQLPALTFTPPGIFGYVDGYAEGVGIPFNPTQARQYLAQAGYPNGQGLPPVTLWFNTNTGHQAIAEYIRQSWYSALGVNVTLQSLEWQQYQAEVVTDHLQVWRLGWCQDYPDANNFVRDVFARGGNANRVGGGVNWYNAAFESLVVQAAVEQDPTARKALYKQAEEILVETDAVIIPIYFYTGVTATKPHLYRTYGLNFGDIAGWRFTPVSDVIGTAGGSLTSYYGDATVHVPAAVVSEPVTMTISPAYGMPPSGDLAGIGHTFDLDAIYESNGLPAQPAPGHTYTVMVDYEQADLGMTRESTLALYWWDGDSWSQQGIVSSVDTAANRVTAQVDHFSLFTVLGETHRVFLPLARQ